MRAGAFKIHNERKDKFCLEKQEVLEGVGHTQLPENSSLWFEQPQPGRSSLAVLGQLRVPQRPKGSSWTIN